MTQEPLAITQTFATPSAPDRQLIFQRKIEHYLKSQLRTTPKPT